MAAGRRIALLVLGAGGLGIMGWAWATWSGIGAGTAPASTASLDPPGAPGVAVANGTVTMTWAAGTAPGAGSVEYRAERRLTSGSTWTDACGTSTTVHLG